MSVVRAGVAAPVLVVVTATAALAVGMLVHASTDCSGSSVSVVRIPFSVKFAGGSPGQRVPVKAVAQRGGEVVARRTVTLDAHGEACELVTGSVPNGHYLIVWGAGTSEDAAGIRIVGAQRRRTRRRARPRRRAGRIWCSRPSRSGRSPGPAASLPWVPLAVLVVLGASGLAVGRRRS